MAGRVQCRSHQIVFAGEKGRPCHLREVAGRRIDLEGLRMRGDSAGSDMAPKRNDPLELMMNWTNPSDESFPV